MSEIRISTLKEESWSFGHGDSFCARTARLVFSQGARNKGWWGDIVWNCQGNTIDTSDDDAEEALEKGLKVVEEYEDVVDGVAEEEASDE